jgi:hypothetical protein
LLEALGADDPVQVLTQHPTIPALAASVPDAQLSRPPAPREWSAWQVLSHLADADLMAGAGAHDRHAGPTVARRLRPGSLDRPLQPAGGVA